MNCSRCNSPLQQGAAFCARCGMNVAPAASPQPAHGYPPPPQGDPAPPQPPQGFAPPPPPQGYPPPFPPPAGFAPPGFPPPPIVTRSSGMAIAGFVLSFFCGLLGLIFSIIGYNECRSSNGTVTGEGLALAGIIISIVSMLIGLMMVASGSHF